ncbi:hypothetical protein ACHAXT_008709 [Thalassiosira profunda]
MRRLHSLLLLAIAILASAGAAGPTVLRIRTASGPVLRVPLPNEDASTTLSSILAAAGVEPDDAAKCQVGLPGKAGGGDPDILDLSPESADAQKTAAELGLKHGSLITILPPPMDKPSKTDAASASIKEEDADRFDPFPDLAKSTSYSAASRRSRALSRGVSRGRTYGDISRVRSTMHAVEPQSKGPLTRVYVCQVGAARFQNHCIVSTPKKKQKQPSGKKRKDEKPKVENRAALLFGTINKERVDQSRKKARTSLSSIHEDDKMCEVAKVHAVWEPPGQKPTLDGKHYDEDCLLSAYAADAEGKLTKESATDRAIRVAGWLGLQPIGWMFSYADEDRHEDGDALPVHGRDAAVGAKLQIETMKRRGREEGRKFVTLALDGRVGATEGFQLSDVCVQMVAEGVVAPPAVDESRQSTRFLDLKDPVVVSGEETKRLDSVLLLVNTAMLSHVGLYSGGAGAPAGGNVKRGSGALLVKTRKRILASMNDGSGVLKELCDFDVLLALDSLLAREDSEKLCLLVRKYARGQKKGTALDAHLNLALQSVLGGDAGIDGDAKDKSYIRPYLKQLFLLARPVNFPVVALFHVLGVHQAVQVWASASDSSTKLLGRLLVHPSMVLVLISLLLVTSTSMITNDYYDAKNGVDAVSEGEDNANEHYHPLARGEVPMSTAKAFDSYLYAVLLLSSPFVPGVIPRLLVIGGAIVTYLYTTHLKPKTWIKNLSCAALVAMSPVTSGLAAWSVLTEGSFLKGLGATPRNNDGYYRFYG